MARAKQQRSLSDILTEELDRRYPVEGRGRVKTMAARRLILEQMKALAEEDAAALDRLLLCYENRRPVPDESTFRSRVSFAEAAAKHWKKPEPEKDEG